MFKTDHINNKVCSIMLINNVKTILSLPQSDTTAPGLP